MVMVACKHGVINGYVRKREYKRRGDNSNIHKRSQNDERSDPEMSTAVFRSVFARGRTQAKEKQKIRDLMISILLL
jgi:hypothetical protein